MRAISLFDFTGTMLQPWNEAGFECHLFDIQHPFPDYRRDDGMWTHQVDLKTVPWDWILTLCEDDEVAIVSTGTILPHCALRTTGERDR